MLDDIYPQVVPGPPKPSAIIEPPVFSMPPGVERYVVEGCGAILVRVEPGDRIEDTQGAVSLISLLVKFVAGGGGE